MEDLAYRRMLDLYYTTEAPLPADPEKVARLIGMRDHTEIVSEILSEFFLKSEKGYENGRCDEEIGAYRAKADRAKSANKARWKHEKSNDFVKSDLKSESVQIPTINHEPLPDIKSVVGQKPDVVPQKEKEYRKNAIEVINFLNERNEADRRVLELLGEKFSLFNGHALLWHLAFRECFLMTFNEISWKTWLLLR
jgi:uncharacterized protein YdaU (DUF1376 family)